MSAPFMAASTSFTNGDVLRKKCELEQKTAFKSVDAVRRGGRACVKKINSKKIIKVVVLFRRHKIAAVTITDQIKIFRSCYIFK